MLPPVIDWEKAARSLRTLRLDTMRGRFVTFAVLATLFTTLVMTLMLYGRNRRSLGDRTGQELRGASSDAAREMGVWLDQRLYDLRLRASPYVVSDNLARATGRNAAQSLNRLRDYLNSVRQNLPAHEGLAIIGRDGQVLTSSGSRTGFRVTPDRLNNLRTRDALVGEPFWDAAINKAALVLVVPIRQDDGVFLGALDSLKDMLDGLSADHTRSLYLITEQGRVVISSAANSADVTKMTLPDATTRELSEREGQTVVQSRPQGREVVAVLRRIPQLRWAAVAETPRAEALRAAGVLRFRTVLLLTSLLVAVGLLAFIVGAFITRPLERLTEAGVVRPGSPDECALMTEPVRLDALGAVYLEVAMRSSPQAGHIASTTPTAAMAMQWTILRPCHIYGPGSQLGCLPLHGRDPKLIDAFLPR